MSIELEKAIELVTSGVNVLESEEISVFEAEGRILSEKIFSVIDQPPFNRSPLDGYAIRALDSAGASQSLPVVLKVIDKVFAGDYAGVPVSEGEAVRIMTGGMLPEGCDCVIRQEDTDSGEDFVQIYKEMKTNDNYVSQGSDYIKGDLLLDAGAKLDSAALAVCSSTGKDTVRVVRRPRVTVVSTGDELVEPGKHLPPGKIYDANFCYMTSRLKSFGMDVVMAAIVKDSKEEISAYIKEALIVSDLIITCGGVSVGQKDLMPIVMNDMGAEMQFHGIKMKPGSPAMFTKLDGLPVLSLSGNPFALMATFELLARPLLFEMNRDPGLLLKYECAKLSTPFKKASYTRRFIRGKFENGRVYLPEGHSSGQLRSTLDCNCFVDIPAGTTALSSDSDVSVVLL